MLFPFGPGQGLANEAPRVQILRRHHCQVCPWVRTLPSILCPKCLTCIALIPALNPGLGLSPRPSPFLHLDPEGFQPLSHLAVFFFFFKGSIHTSSPWNPPTFFQWRLEGSILQSFIYVIPSTWNTALPNLKPSWHSSSAFWSQLKYYPLRQIPLASPEEVRYLVIYSHRTLHLSFVAHITMTINYSCNYLVNEYHIKLGVAVRVLAGNRWYILVGSLILRLRYSKSIEPLFLLCLKGQEEREWLLNSGESCDYT